MSRAWGNAYMRVLRPVIRERFDAKTSRLPASFDMLGVQVDAAITHHVPGAFDKMATSVNKANARTQEVVGIKSSDIGLEDFVKQQRAKNVELVRNAHNDFREKVRDLFENEANDGMGEDTFAERLAERLDVSDDRAELIARDQVLTLNGQITQERQTAAGVESYVWSTSLDERVREEHAILEGETFDWDNPPDVGHPGEDINCRCVAVPVVDELADLFDD